jgi:hypothetical protein
LPAGVLSVGWFLVGGFGFYIFGGPGSAVAID